VPSLIRTGRYEYTIAAIALDSGFSTVSTSTMLQKKYKVTPSAFVTANLSVLLVICRFSFSDPTGNEGI